MKNSKVIRALVALLVAVISFGVFAAPASAGNYVSGGARYCSAGYVAAVRYDVAGDAQINITSTNGYGIAVVRRDTDPAGSDSNDRHSGTVVSNYQNISRWSVSAYNSNPFASGAYVVSAYSFCTFKVW